MLSKNQVSPVHNTPQLLQVVLKNSSCQPNPHFTSHLLHGLSDLGLMVLYFVSFIHNDSGPINTVRNYTRHKKTRKHERSILYDLKYMAWNMTSHEILLLQMNL